MQDAAVLKGTKDGYEIILDENANVQDIYSSLRKLLDNLKTQTASTNPQTIAFDIYTGMRLWPAEDRSEIEKIFSDYELFSVHKITADVITKAESNRILEQSSVHIVDRVIRNGQEVHIEGDVLFWGPSMKAESYWLLAIFSFLEMLKGLSKQVPLILKIR